MKKCREKKKRRHKQSRSKIHSREDSPFLPPPSNHSRIVEFTDRVLTYPSIHESVGGDRIFLSSMLSIIALHRYVYMYVYIYISLHLHPHVSSMNSYKLHRFTAGRLPIYRGIYRLIPRARAQQGDMYT